MQTSAREAFDALELDATARLTWQTYLLTGHRHRAAHCVRRAFQLAWNNWAVVGADSSPEGWVRARAMELALSPWHRGGPRMQHLLRLPHRQLRVPDDTPGHLGLRDRALVRALLRLPRPQRHALVLHDVVGLDWKQTATEVESSTPAAYGRVARARRQLARSVPALVGDDPSSAGFGRRLGAQARAAAIRSCGAEPRNVRPARTRMRARLHDGGLTVAAAVLVLGTVGAIAGATADGGSFAREAPVRATPASPTSAPTSTSPAAVTAARVGGGTPARGAAAEAPAEVADPGLWQRAAFPATPLRVPSRAADRAAPAWSFCGLFAIPCGHH
ncbi:sigma factor-like helix-turn-helix DNA-binding protein [Streptacidiphilus monticola]|uniref:Sigma factor-like helix-turn-helix DNA-binding protein n=1 Tax=Streptacidiphilus monticola TaxID=2161674 RepID=A0ABW1FYG0_9ACTN